MGELTFSYSKEYSRAHSKHEPRQPALGAPRIHGELLKLGIEISQDFGACEE